MHETDVYLYVLLVLLKHILISLISFMGMPNLMRVLYNVALPIES